MQDTLFRLGQQNFEDVARVIRLFEQVAARETTPPATPDGSKGSSSSINTDDRTGTPSTTPARQSLPTTSAVTPSHGVRHTRRSSPPQPPPLSAAAPKAGPEVGDGGGLDGDHSLLTFIDLPDDLGSDDDTGMATHTVAADSAQGTSILAPTVTAITERDLVPLRWGPVEGRDVILQRFGDVLGKGEAAVVHRGRLFICPARTDAADSPPSVDDCELVRDVAVKVFRTSWRRYPSSETVIAGLAERFALRHPCIVSVYFCFPFPTDPLRERWLPDMSNATSMHLALAMEYGNGGTLGAELQRRERLPESVVRSVLLDLLPAVRYLHDEVGVVHNDIKPLNILIFTLESGEECGGSHDLACSSEQGKKDSRHAAPSTRADGGGGGNSSESTDAQAGVPVDSPLRLALSAPRYKLSDFGLSRRAVSDALSPARLQQIREDMRLHKHRKTELLGTATFMSPESCLGVGNSTTNDIWSIGVTVFQLLTGQVPWRQMESAYPYIITNGFRERFAMGCLFRNSTQTPRGHGPGEELINPGNHLATFGPVLDEVDSSVYSPEARDFVKSCLVEDPLKRPTCTQLMQHPLVLGGKLPG